MHYNLMKSFVNIRHASDINHISLATVHTRIKTVESREDIGFYARCYSVKVEVFE